MPAVPSPFTSASASARASVNSDLGGNSSVPISNRKSRVLIRDPPVHAVPQRARSTCNSKPCNSTGSSLSLQHGKAERLAAREVSLRNPPCQLPHPQDV